MGSTVTATAAAPSTGFSTTAAIESLFYETLPGRIHGRLSRILVVGIVGHEVGPGVGYPGPGLLCSVLPYGVVVLGSLLHRAPRLP